MNPYKFKKHKFDFKRSIIEQLFCKHDYKAIREHHEWYSCLFLKCNKCGKLRDLNYYFNKRW